MRQSSFTQEDFSKILKVSRSVISKALKQVPFAETSHHRWVEVSKVKHWYYRYSREVAFALAEELSYRNDIAYSIHVRRSSKNALQEALTSEVLKLRSLIDVIDEEAVLKARVILANREGLTFAEISAKVSVEYCEVSRILSNYSERRPVQLRLI